MLSNSLRILYLHGFASSPQSRKAQFFAGRLQAFGYPISIPDLAAGDFEHLTVSGQLQLLERELQDRPAILIGSSLGGYLAALYAACHPEIERLVLFAPAFGFCRLWEAELGPDRMHAWRQRGTIQVFHHRLGREVPLGYQFIEDARQFEPFPDARQPILICHGTHDPVVPLEQSLQFVTHHPSARLVPFTSGHELTDVLEGIWDETAAFLKIALPAN